MLDQICTTGTPIYIPVRVLHSLNTTLRHSWFLMTWLWELRISCPYDCACQECQVCTWNDNVIDSSQRHNAHKNDAAVIFSSRLVERLSRDRLPPTYIGVRRVRPVTTTVAASSNNKFTALSSSIVFKIIKDLKGMSHDIERKERMKIPFCVAFTDIKRNKITSCY
jgi:hypothetical protein